MNGGIFKGCHHIRWNAVDPVEVTIHDEDPHHTISGGNDNSTSHTYTIWQCPICHEQCDEPNKKEWTDE